MQGIESLGYEVRDQPLVPDGGMQQLKGAADLLAEFGRNGDTYVVHAAEGETVLPMEVLESSPKLKKMIYAQMEELGLQPERYVIGNELNSLNPVTGQPEFFFKKLFKKIKKVGKKVINIAKKVAPIVLPLALPFLAPIGVPLFLSAGIGSLAGNLIAGNSFKDSLKAAALTAVTAGVAQGLGGSEFIQGIKDSVGTGIDSLTQGASTLGEQLTTASASAPVPGFDIGDGLSSISNLASSNAPVTDSFFAEAFGSGLPDISLDTVTSNQVAGPIVAGTEVGPVSASTGTGFGDMRAGIDNLSGFEASMAPARAATLNQTMPSGQLAGAPSELFDPAFQVPMVPGADPASFVSTSGMNAPNMPTAQYAQGTTPANVGTMDPSSVPAPSFLDDPIQGIQDLYGKYLSPSRPSVGEDAGVLTKYGPLLAVGGAGILAADALFPPEEQERLQLGDGRTGQDLLDEDIRSGTFQYGFNPRMFYGNNPYYQRGQFTQARQGGEIDGPGTGTSDSIPAMLSDGEFVMTAKAVRGAGGNDRKEGAKKMYAMMRKFENEAAA